MNPDAWVAARNIDRFDAGTSLDTAYLSTLSADATPVIVERLPERPGLLHHDRVVGHAVRDRRLAGVEPRPQPGRDRAGPAGSGRGRPDEHLVLGPTSTDDYTG